MVDMSWKEQIKVRSLNGGPFKPVLLRDGTVVSIQAGGGFYSLPRLDSDDIKVYTHFEIGFPDAIIPEIMEYAENENNPLNTVYCYVPDTVISKFIERCGGILTQL